MAIPVTHLIKGYLNREVLAMIRPYPHIQLMSVPRPLFRAWIWWWLCWWTGTGRLRWLLVDHERTLREVSWWCRAFGPIPVFIREADQGYELQVHGQRLPLTAVFQR